MRPTLLTYLFILAFFYGQEQPPYIGIEVWGPEAATHPDPHEIREQEEKEAMEQFEGRAGGYEIMRECIENKIHPDFWK